MVVNDRHPSGMYFPNASAADVPYGNQPGCGQDGGGISWDDDPLFGALPGAGHGAALYGAQAPTTDQVPNYAPGYQDTAGYGTAYDTTTAYGTAAFDAGSYPAYGSGDTGAYATGLHDTGSHGYVAQGLGVQNFQDFDAQDFGVQGPGLQSPGTEGTPGVDARSYGTQDIDAQGFAAPAFGTGTFAAPGYDTVGPSAPVDAVIDDPLFGVCGEYGGGQPWDSGAYPAVNPRPEPPPFHQQGQPAEGVYPTADGEPDHGYHPEITGGHDFAPAPGTADLDGGTGADLLSGPPVPEYPGGEDAPDDETEPGPGWEPAGDDADEDEPVSVSPVPPPRRAASRTGGTAAPIRSRRRKPARRSALLTVAVPSVAVMGVAGVTAATVVSPDTGSESAADSAQSDATTAVANAKLDKQLASLTADADDFADRASRTQERIDLKERQTAERKRKAVEAARKEALRPKFALPVTTTGLSAMYGQAGVNWMSLHTGIDFPVSYGTPVLAATDGTVTTKWGGAYGNMVIVTAADGTETWYCHLSSTRIRSGVVKAGDTIAYSGNSGNSTGPHLHFEVHPGGGAAIDPLQWLLNKGLDPR